MALHAKLIPPESKAQFQETVAIDTDGKPVMLIVREIGSPEVKDEVSHLIDKESKIDYLVQLITFVVSVGVITPVFPASKTCAADAKCAALFGPLNHAALIPVLNNETALKVLGSANYIIANALYAYLESAEAWKFFCASTKAQRILFIGLVLPALCAQETIFSLTQGNTLLYVVFAATGAAPGALFTFMQLVQYFQSGPLADFKWKNALIGDDEALHYSHARAKLLALFKANLDGLHKKLKQNQFPENYPKDKKKHLKFLLQYEAPSSEESACSRNTKRVLKYGIGVGAMSSVCLTPNIVNTFNFFKKYTGESIPAVMLNSALTGLLLTKNIYTTSVFLADFVGGVYDEIRNRLQGKESEWALLRVKEKSKLLIAPLAITFTLGWTLWTRQTQFGLYEKNKATLGEDLRVATLDAAWLFHFVIVMKMTDKVLAQIVLTDHEKFLRQLQNEIAEIEAMNYAEFKKRFEELVADPIAKATLSKNNVDPFIVITPTNNSPSTPRAATVESRTDSYVATPTAARLLPPKTEPSFWQRLKDCCGKRPDAVDPNAVVVSQPGNNR